MDTDFDNSQTNYKIFLNSLSNLLAKYFENQKEYIHCKPGCSYCCESGEYPFSQLEFDFAMHAFLKLPPEIKLQINSQVKSIKQDKLNFYKHNFDTSVFMHKCPFLINKKCCIYEHRGIICRTFGLLYYVQCDGEMSTKAPACNLIGLNYSEVNDSKKGIISKKMFEDSGYKTEPKVYNLAHENIINTTLTKQLNLNFGVVKPLIDFFNI